MYSPLEQFDAIKLISFGCSYLGHDYTFFSVLVPMVLMVIFFYLIPTFSMNFLLMPKLFQSIFELNMEFMFNLIKQQIGKKGYKLFPMMFLLFNFMLLNNLLSLMPFGMALTSHLMIILWMSLSLSLGIFMTGINLHNINFLKMFIPECPLMLLPLLIVMEVFSYIISSFSLAIRLSANIMAGHTLVNMMSAFILKMSSLETLMFSFGLVMMFMILLLELGVAFLQAYVFTVLTCMYIHDAIYGGSH